MTSGVDQWFPISDPTAHVSTVLITDASRFEPERLRRTTDEPIAICPTLENPLLQLMRSKRDSKEEVENTVTFSSVSSAHISLPKFDFNVNWSSMRLPVIVLPEVTEEDLTVEPIVEEDVMTESFTYNPDEEEDEGMLGEEDDKNNSDSDWFSDSDEETMTSVISRPNVESVSAPAPEVDNREQSVEVIRLNVDIDKLKKQSERARLKSLSKFTSVHDMLTYTRPVGYSYKPMLFRPVHPNPFSFLDLNNSHILLTYKKTKDLVIQQQQQQQSTDIVTFAPLIHLNLLSVGPNVYSDIVRQYNPEVLSVQENVKVFDSMNKQQLFEIIKSFVNNIKPHINRNLQQGFAFFKPYMVFSSHRQKSIVEKNFDNLDTVRNVIFIEYLEKAPILKPFKGQKVKLMNYVNFETTDISRERINESILSLVPKTNDSHPLLPHSNINGIVRGDIVFVTENDTLPFLGSVSENGSRLVLESQLAYTPLHYSPYNDCRNDSRIKYGDFLLNVFDDFITIQEMPLVFNGVQQQPNDINEGKDKQYLRDEPPSYPTFKKIVETESKNSKFFKRQYKKKPGRGPKCKFDIPYIAVQKARQMQDPELVSSGLYRMRLMDQGDAKEKTLETMFYRYLHKVRHVIAEGGNDDDSWDRVSYLGALVDNITQILKTTVEDRVDFYTLGITKHDLNVDVFKPFENTEHLQDSVFSNPNSFKSFRNLVRNMMVQDRNIHLNNATSDGALNPVARELLNNMRSNYPLGLHQYSRIIKSRQSKKTENQLVQLDVRSVTLKRMKTTIHYYDRRFYQTLPSDAQCRARWQLYAFYFLPWLTNLINKGIIDPDDEYDDEDLPENVWSKKMLCEMYREERKTTAQAQIVMYNKFSVVQDIVFAGLDRDSIVNREKSTKDEEISLQYPSSEDLVEANKYIEVDLDEANNNMESQLESTRLKQMIHKKKKNLNAIDKLRKKKKDRLQQLNDQMDNMMVLRKLIVGQYNRFYKIRYNTQLNLTDAEPSPLEMETSFQGIMDLAQEITDMPLDDTDHLLDLCILFDKRTTHLLDRIYNLLYESAFDSKDCPVNNPFHTIREALDAMNSSHMSPIDAAENVRQVIEAIRISQKASSKFFKDLINMRDSHSISTILTESIREKCIDWIRKTDRFKRKKRLKECVVSLLSMISLWPKTHFNPIRSDRDLIGNCQITLSRYLNVLKQVINGTKAEPPCFDITRVLSTSECIYLRHKSVDQRIFTGYDNRMYLSHIKNRPPELRQRYLSTIETSPDKFKEVQRYLTHFGLEQAARYIDITITLEDGKKKTYKEPVYEMCNNSFILSKKKRIMMYEILSYHDRLCKKQFSNLFSPNPSEEVECVPINLGSEYKTSLSNRERDVDKKFGTDKALVKLEYYSKARSTSSRPSNATFRVNKPKKRPSIIAKPPVPTEVLQRIMSMEERYVLQLLFELTFTTSQLRFCDMFKKARSASYSSVLKYAFTLNPKKEYKTLVTDFFNPFIQINYITTIRSHLDLIEGFDLGFWCTVLKKHKEEEFQNALMMILAIRIICFCASPVLQEYYEKIGEQGTFTPDQLLKLSKYFPPITIPFGLTHLNIQEHHSFKRYEEAERRIGDYRARYSSVVVNEDNAGTHLDFVYPELSLLLIKKCPPVCASSPAPLLKCLLPRELNDCSLVLSQFKFVFSHTNILLIQWWLLQAVFKKESPFASQFQLFDDVVRQAHEKVATKNNRDVIDHWTIKKMLLNWKILPNINTTRDLLEVMRQNTADYTGKNSLFVQFASSLIQDCQLAETFVCSLFDGCCDETRRIFDQEFDLSQFVSEMREHMMLDDNQSNFDIIKHFYTPNIADDNKNMTVIVKYLEYHWNKNFPEALYLVLSYVLRFNIFYVLSGILNACVVNNPDNSLYVKPTDPIQLVEPKIEILQLDTMPMSMSQDTPTTRSMDLSLPDMPQQHDNMSMPILDMIPPTSSLDLPNYDSFSLSMSPGISESTMHSSPAIKTPPSTIPHVVDDVEENVEKVEEPIVKQHVESLEYYVQYRLVLSCQHILREKNVEFPVDSYHYLSEFILELALNNSDHIEILCDNYPEFTPIVNVIQKIIAEKKAGVIPIKEEEEEPKIDIPLENKKKVAEIKKRIKEYKESQDRLKQIMFDPKSLSEIDDAYISAIRKININSYAESTSIMYGAYYLFRSSKSVLISRLNYTLALNIQRYSKKITDARKAIEALSRKPRPKTRTTRRHINILDDEEPGRVAVINEIPIGRRYLSCELYKISCVLYNYAVCIGLPVDFEANNMDMMSINPHNALKYINQPNPRWVNIFGRINVLYYRSYIDYLKDLDNIIRLCLLYQESLVDQAVKLCVFARCLFERAHKQLSKFCEILPLDAHRDMFRQFYVNNEATTNSTIITRIQGLSQTEMIPLSGLLNIGYVLNEHRIMQSVILDDSITKFIVCQSPIMEFNPIYPFHTELYEKLLMTPAWTMLISHHIAYRRLFWLHYNVFHPSNPLAYFYVDFAEKDPYPTTARQLDISCIYDGKALTSLFLEEGGTNIPSISQYIMYIEQMEKIVTKSVATTPKSRFLSLLAKELVEYTKALANLIPPLPFNSKLERDTERVKAQRIEIKTKYQLDLISYYGPDPMFQHHLFFDKSMADVDRKFAEKIRFNTLSYLQNNIVPFIPDEKQSKFKKSLSFKFDRSSYFFVEEAILDILSTEKAQQFMESIRSFPWLSYISTCLKDKDLEKVKTMYTVVFDMFTGAKQSIGTTALAASLAAGCCYVGQMMPEKYYQRVLKRVQQLATPAVETVRKPNTSVQTLRPPSIQEPSMHTIPGDEFSLNVSRSISDAPKKSATNESSFSLLL
ncbi:hypothetical protein PCE1_003873 [Barthelona sp. PCE]